MRSEQEMMDLVLGYATRDERVRAVTLKAPEPTPTCLRIYFRITISAFMLRTWRALFRTRIGSTSSVNGLFCKARKHGPVPPDLGGWFSYLMLFTDGNRIDMTLIPIEEKENTARRTN